jgi:hypothetical protein
LSDFYFGYSGLFGPRKKNKQHRELALTLFIMASGAVIFQLFNTSYFNSVMWMPLGIATAGAVLIKQDHLS